MNDGGPHAQAAQALDQGGALIEDGVAADDHREPLQRGDLQGFSHLAQTLDQDRLQVQKPEHSLQHTGLGIVRIDHENFGFGH
jgi:hypothetical protein